MKISNPRLFLLACPLLFALLPSAVSRTPGATLGDLPGVNQVVLFDRFHSWTKHTFTEVLEKRPWGDEFADGNLYLRYEIIDKPSDIEVAPMICLWQGQYSQEGFGENCTRRETLVSFSEPGVYYALIPGPGVAGNNWSPAYNSRPFNENASVDRIMHQWWVETDRWRVLRADTGADYDYGPGVEVHIPIRFRATAILVKKGALLDPPSEWSGFPDEWVQESKHVTTGHAVLYEDQETANSRGQLFVGRTADPDSVARRALVRFDIPAIPEEARIVDASLRMVVSSVGENIEEAVFPANLHRVTMPWQEGSSTGTADSGQAPQAGEATWMQRSYPSDGWSTAGGDFMPNPSATLSLSSEDSFSGYLFWSDPAMVEDLRHWLANPEDNHGWIIIGDESQAGTGIGFSNRFGRAEEAYPTLFINYVFGDFPTWSGWVAINAEGDVEDLGRFGWINILQAPWIYVYGMDQWVYSPDPATNWFFIPRYP